MIESQEQLRQTIYGLALIERGASKNSIYTMHIDELIESLRNVARAGKELRRHWNIPSDEWDREPERAAEDALEEALDTCPPWALEESDENR